MIAALPMYDRPEIRAETDAFWSAIASHLAEVGFSPPFNLTRDGNLWDIWQSPDLLLAQTCGLPYRARLHGKVTLVGTPDYGLTGCPPGHYCSVIVARASTRADPAQLHSPRLAFNEGLSQSGWCAPLDWAARYGVRFGSLLKTGSHAASAHAVLNGEADLAGIDAVTWRLLTRHDPTVHALRTIAQTHPTPGLPLITRAGQDPAPIAEAVRAAIGALSATDRRALSLEGLAAIPAESYLAQQTPPSPSDYAKALGIDPPLSRAEPR